MGYLSGHYYKLMKSLKPEERDNTAIRFNYQRERIKSWWLDEESFIENWARPNIQRVLDEEVEKMLDDAFKDVINVNLNIFK